MMRPSPQEKIALKDAIEQNGLGSVNKAASGIGLQDQFGLGMSQAIPVANEVFDLLLHYGAYRDLGLRKMIGAFRKYAEATA